MATRKTSIESGKSSSSAATKKNSQERAQPNTQAVAHRAWEIWDRSGRPQGREMENWLQAEKELRRS